MARGNAYDATVDERTAGRFKTEGERGWASKASAVEGRAELKLVFLFLNYITYSAAFHALAHFSTMQC
jgi:hypothetical protein